MRLLGDDDVRHLQPDEAARAMREALRSHTEGSYLSPPRLSMTFGENRVLFGAGGGPDGAMGLRISGTAASPLEHVTVTWLPSGEVDAVILGNELGARRTGAVAAVAADLLAAPGALRVGILGSGRNGWAQVWGLTGVRPITELRIYSPTASHRTLFAERARLELGLEARAVDTAREAVEGMDVVVLCTTSRTPIMESSWVSAGAHVASIGAKSTSAHEAPAELLERMSQVVSDAPAELDSPFPDLANLPLVSLGELLTSPESVRRTGDVSLFLYSGLGGADAAFARAVSESAR
jgi:ornithine cyclodeaminase/alanine dehydrogenase-like protein (mu-crystallin family)